MLSSSRSTVPRLAKRGIHTTIPSTISIIQSATRAAVNHHHVPAQGAADSSEFVPFPQRTIFHHAMLPADVARIFDEVDKIPRPYTDRKVCVAELCELSELNEEDVKLLLKFRDLAVELRDKENEPETLEYFEAALFGEGICPTAAYNVPWVSVEDLTGIFWPHVVSGERDFVKKINVYIGKKEPKEVSEGDEQTLNGQSPALQSVEGSEDEVNAAFPHDAQSDSTADTITLTVDGHTFQVSGDSMVVIERD